jgi:hypothetical protein
MKSWEVIGLLLSAVGAVSAVLYLLEKYRSQQKLSWWQAQQSAKRIAEKLLFENFASTLIIGISRDGAEGVGVVTSDRRFVHPGQCPVQYTREFS